MPGLADYVDCQMTLWPVLAGCLHCWLDVLAWQHCWQGWVTVDGGVLQSIMAQGSTWWGYSCTVQHSAATYFLPTSNTFNLSQKRFSCWRWCQAALRLQSAPTTAEHLC